MLGETETKSEIGRHRDRMKWTEKRVAEGEQHGKEKEMFMGLSHYVQNRDSNTSRVGQDLSDQLGQSPLFLQ